MSRCSIPRSLQDRLRVGRGVALERDAGLPTAAPGRTSRDRSRRGSWWSSWRRSATYASAGASATCSSSSSAARSCGAGTRTPTTARSGRWPPAGAAPPRSSQEKAELGKRIKKALGELQTARDALTVCLIENSPPAPVQPQLSVIGVEVVNSVQRRQNPVRLVRGRSAIVRAFVGSGITHFYDGV
jgi:hypothetical protein